MCGAGLKGAEPGSFFAPRPLSFLSSMYKKIKITKKERKTRNHQDAVSMATYTPLGNRFTRQEYFCALKFFPTTHHDFSLPNPLNDLPSSCAVQFKQCF